MTDENFTGLSNCADTNGFIVVYPESTSFSAPGWFAAAQGSSATTSAYPTPVDGVDNPFMQANSTPVPDPGVAVQLAAGAAMLALLCASRRPVLAGLDRAQRLARRRSRGSGDGSSVLYDPEQIRFERERLRTLVRD
jgi:hypothetical protein